MQENTRCLQKNYFMKKILVIKHGALGDLIQTTGIFRSISEHHKNDVVVLLVDKKFKFFIENAPYFNHIIYDERPSFIRLDLWIKVIRKLVKESFDIVYDLQNSDRTSIYNFFININNNCLWSGNRKGGRLRYNPNDFEKIPVLKRLYNQLKIINLEVNLNPDLSWMDRDISEFIPINKYIILIPGSSKNLKHKRWPANNFGELALRLQTKGYDIAIIGTNDERNEIEKIKSYSSKFHDFSNNDLSFVAALCRSASGVVANDTGPTFIAGAVNCPVTWLLSHHTNPDLVRPQCKKLKIIKKQDISDILVSDVENNLALRS